MNTHLRKHLHTYPDNSSSEEYILESKHGLVTVDPEGGYVTSWKVKNSSSEFMDILYRGSAKKRTGIPILFPYFGKARHTKQHGFGRDSVWKVVESSHTSIQLKLISSHISADAKKEYPYSFEADLIITLHENGTMDYILSVINRDTKDIPISPGIHPYWDIAHEEKKNIAVPDLKDFDAASVDWDKNPPDIAYPFEKKVDVHFPDRTIEIEDISPHNKKIRHLVVWSQPIDKPDYNFVCFEPVCGDNYTIDDNPILVSPQKNWVMKLKFSVEFRK